MDLRRVIIIILIILLSANFAFSAVSLKSQGTKITVKAATVQPNVPLVSIPITVGADKVNVPMVSVTICLPGTSTCTTVNNIKLDTGSVGLRLFKSTLSGLNFPITTNSGGEVGVCDDFDGGGNYWGPLAKADIKFGSLTASSVPFQVVDPTYKSGSLPNTSDFHCASPVQNPTAAGANGILGVSDSLTLCSSIECTGTQYYSFGSSVTNISIASSSTFPLAQHIQNPVASLPANYNNGVTIVFPPVASSGAASITGTMYLGIFVFPANPIPTISMCPTDYRSFFTSLVNGTYYWSILDSGTNANALSPTELANETGLKKCNSDSSNPYYCPSGASYSKNVTLMGGSTYGSTGITCGSPTLSVTASVLNSPPNYVFSNNMRPSTNTLVLGMPFFYGKTTYFVIDGRSSLLGTGPQIGYSN